MTRDALAVSADTRLAADGCQSEADDLFVVRSTSPPKAKCGVVAFPGQVLSLAFSPEQNLLAMGSFGGELTALGTDSGEAAAGPITLDPWLLTAIAWTPDGESLMVGVRSVR